ncbi:MAG: polysaccharide deacetylase family protein [Acidobacteriota bacterium]
MRRVIIAFAVAAPVALIALWPHAPLAAIGILALSHALLLYPTLRPNVQWLGPVVTWFEPEGNEVWLTIDDGPTGDTAAILDILDARSAKATFFVKGVLARQRPDLIRAIVERGHGVGNHSDTHPSATFWCLTPAAIAAEIDGCTAAIPPTPWFRAPVGMKNPAVHPALARRGMRLIGWSARGFDGVSTDIDQIVRRILPRAFPGAIVVLHQGREASAACIARVVDELRARGYAFVIPADERLKTKR